MGDSLKKVKSGDPLVIPAATYNTFVDAARDYLARQQDQAQMAKAFLVEAATVISRMVHLDEAGPSALALMAELMKCLPDFVCHIVCRTLDTPQVQ